MDLTTRNEAKKDLLARLVRAAERGDIGAMTTDGILLLQEVEKAVLRASLDTPEGAKLNDISKARAMLGMPCGDEARTVDGTLLRGDDRHAAARNAFAERSRRYYERGTEYENAPTVNGTIDEAPILDVTLDAGPDTIINNAPDDTAAIPPVRRRS